MIDFITEKVLPVVAVFALLWLQILFSRFDNKKMGLILPGVCLGFSIFWVLLVGGLALPSITSDAANQFKILDLVKIFLVINIPTVVLYAIYRIVRMLRKKK